MQNITVNVLHKEFVSLPSVESSAVLTLTIRKASGSTLAGGTFTFVAGKEWLLTFTPATLNEVYGVVVTDADGDLVFSESFKALGQVWDAVTGPAGNIVVGTNSFCTAQEAEDYFATRLVSSLWDAATAAIKVRALITAYWHLVNCGDYTFPAEVANYTTGIKQAQYEMASFLLQHGADMDARLGLQAQGVIKSGIVQEEYVGGVTVPIPPIVRTLLSSLVTSGSNLEAVELTRDDDEDIT